jgi:hypothetical protein
MGERYLLLNGPMGDIPVYRRWDGTMAVCVPRRWSRAEVEAQVNASLTSDRLWVLSRRRKLTPFLRLPQDCPSDTDRVHYLMETAAPGAEKGGGDGRLRAAGL